ncbi:MAG: 3D domain-containing protein [Tissierellaceae bacterium]|nr:3D domain-containing protein [Tissierellaceae bacterium]
MEEHPLKKTWKFRVLVALVAAVVVSLGAYILQDSKMEVTINLDNEVKVLASKADTVEDFLEENNIVLEKGTYIDVALGAEIENKMTIRVIRPKPYTIEADKVEIDVKSIHYSVGEILAENNIVLGDKDFTSPRMEDHISPGGKISLFRVEEVIEAYDQPIPFENIVNKNHSMDIGTSKTIQDGEDGLKTIYVRKEFVDGRLLSAETIGEEVALEPVSKIVEKGTKDIIVTSRGDTRYRKALTMSATAYDLSYESCRKNPGDPGYGITASGTKARPGVVAVDPRVIPLGTKLYIQSLDGSKDYGFAIAEDTGGAIKGNKVDLFYEDSNIVNRFGRRKVKVYVLND